MPSNPTRWQRAPRRSDRVPSNVDPVDPGLALLLSASSWYDARDLSSSAAQTLPNRANPSASAAQLGSTSGSDTNDPVALTYDGVAYLNFPGAASNTVGIASTGDQTSVSVTSIRVRRTRVTTPGAAQFYQSAAGATTARWYCEYSSAGLLRVTTTDNGTAGAQVASIGTDAAVLTAVWVRWDINWAANTASAFWSNDTTRSDAAVTWTQVGSATSLGATARRPPSSQAQIGNASLALNAGIDRYVIKFDSTTVVDVNPASETLGQSSWTCTTGQTVTVTRATSGLTTAVVTRPLLMADGTDDYLQLPASDTPTFTAASGSETVLWVGRKSYTSTSSVYSSESSLDNGLEIYDAGAGTGNFIVRVQGSTGAGGRVERTALSGYSHSANALVAVGAVVSAGTAYGYSNSGGLTAGASIAGVGTLTHNTPRLGSRAYIVNLNANGEYVAFARWARALTAAELDAVSAYLLGSYS